MANLVGRTLQRQYRIEEAIGRGGMAEVYRAYDLRRNHRVAIKVLREDLAEDWEFVRRFRSEAESLERLAHQHIVRFYSFEQEGPLAFIVMDFIDGTTLRGRLFEAEGRLPPAEALGIIRQVTAALHYAHSEGIIHRDVKPGNVMLTTSGQALLSDFGIAKATDASTLTTYMPGTPAYMSPEQCRGEPLDVRADVYSLGVMLYEMLAGRRPFLGEQAPDTVTGGTRERIRWEQMHATPPSPRLLVPGLPESVAQVILKAIAKEREERFPSVLALWEALQEASAGWVSPEEMRAVPVESPRWVLPAAEPAAGAKAAWAPPGTDQPSSEGVAVPLPGSKGSQALSRSRPLLAALGVVGGAGAVLVAAVLFAQGLGSRNASIAAALTTSTPTATKTEDVASSPTPPLGRSATAPASSEPADSASPSTSRTAAPGSTPQPTFTPRPTETLPATTAPTETGTVVPTATIAPPATGEPAASPTLEPTATAGEPSPTPAPTATPAPVRPGVIADFEADTAWQRGDQAYGELTRSNEQAQAGSYSGKLSYSFPAAADNFVVFSPRPPLPLSGNPTGVSAWVYGNGSGHFLNAWIQDSGGELRAYTFGSIGFQGWQRMTAWFDEQRGWPNGRISGPDNNALDSPVSLYGIVLDGVPDGQASDGAIYLDELTITTQPVPSSSGATAQQPTQQSNPTQAPPAPAEPSPTQPLPSGEPFRGALIGWEPNCTGNQVKGYVKNSSGGLINSGFVRVKLYDNLIDAQVGYSSLGEGGWDWGRWGLEFLTDPVIVAYYSSDGQRLSNEVVVAFSGADNCGPGEGGHQVATVEFVCQRREVCG